MNLKRIRVLHCPDIVGGNAQTIARIERELGIDSWSVAFRQTVFSYPCDEVLLQPGDGFLKSLFAKVGLFLRGMVKFDLIHYNFGHTIFPTHIPQKTGGKLLDTLWNYVIRIFFMADLRLFHKFGKVIAVTFQGDDIRQGKYSLDHFDISIAKVDTEGYYSLESDCEKQEIIRNFDRNADLIYFLNPDLGHILPSRAKFLPYANVDLRELQIVETTNNPIPLVIHAPSHRGVKGTGIIIDTVNRLLKNGLNFEFQLVEGLSNKDARTIYQQADLLIDQLFAGWYGGVAVELMALGKPVLSYIRESDLIFIPLNMRNTIPIINTNADTLYNNLKNCLENESKLKLIGKESRNFVENWHNPIKIAEQLKNDYYKALLSKHP